MKKYLYTLLALLMVKLHAQELSSTPIRSLPDEFSSPLNVDEEKVFKMLLRKDKPHMDEFLCPYIGTVIFNQNLGVAYRNKTSTMEMDLRFSSMLVFSRATFTVSKMVMFGDKDKGHRWYMGFGSGIGVYFTPTQVIKANKGFAIFPRFFFGVEKSYGFKDFSIDLMMNPLTGPVALPIPDLRWGFRF